MLLCRVLLLEWQVVLAAQPGMVFGVLPSACKSEKGFGVGVVCAFTNLEAPTCRQSLDLGLA